MSLPTFPCLSLLKRRVFRTLVAPLLAFCMAMLPINAHAASCTACFWSGYMTACTECAAVFQQLVQLINQTTDMINHNIDRTRQALSSDIRDATDSIVAAIEKADGAQKELKQGELNYDAALASQQAAAKADDMFTSALADIQNPSNAANACATASTAEAATTAAHSARTTGRARSAVALRPHLYSSNSAAIARDVTRVYNENFCSVEDRQRGRCTNVAPLHMQAASLSAGSLLTPAGGETYSPPEERAAEEFIRMVVGPVPQEVLPIAVEKTEAGERFLLEQRSGAAVLSMALHSLQQIFAAHSSEEGPGSANAGASISLVGLMKKFVEDRFGKSDYEASLRELNEVGLLRQMAVSMAFKNWMDYHAYLQGERTEALLATTLALSARDRNDARLEALRAKALATR